MITKPALIVIFFALLVSACADDKACKPVSATAPVHVYEKVSENKPAFILSTSVAVEPCSLDEINESPAQEISRITNKSQVTLAGWAANVPKGAAVNEIWLEFAGQKSFYLKVAAKEQRPDVVSAFNKPAMLDSGWRTFADLGNLSNGAYEVRILMPDAGGYLVCDTKRQLRAE